MKKFKLLVLFSIIFYVNNSFGQAWSTPNLDPKWDNQYHNEAWTASDIADLMEKVKFKPISQEMQGVDLKYLKVVLLQLSNGQIEQMNRDAWYLGSTKHDDYYKIWNMLYANITKEFWDKNCKGLLCLMLIDKTAIAH